MKAYQFTKKGGLLELANKPIPTPGDRQVRVKVHSCGICHSDIISQHDGLGGGFPRVPGHEISGVVDEVGPHVTKVKKGDRVGVGWYGTSCGSCVNCVEDELVCCQKHNATGVHFDGGYAEYTIAREDAVARIPDGLDFSSAGPLMCAGITSFNALRHSGAKGGDVVGIVGLGGLGHLGVQFANKLGYKVVAISRGEEKRELALKLGAHHYIDTKTQDPGPELQKLGGAKVILYTATNGDGINPLISGLKVKGKILLVAALFAPVPIETVKLIGMSGSIQSWAAGDARDSEDTLNFAHLTGVRPMIEKFKFSQANEAFKRMESNNARFRVVLEGWD